MKRFIYRYCFILLLTSGFIQQANSQEVPDVYLPDLLPQIDFGTHVCGTMILLGIPDIANLQFIYPENKASEQEEVQQVQAASIGEQRKFHVFNIEESSGIDQRYDYLLFELRAVGEFSEIWVEVEELGEGRITQEVVDEVVNSLENETPSGSYDPGRGIIDINRQLFGEAPDVDGSGKVKVLLVDIRDGWDPETGGGFVAGFFNPNDLSPALGINGNINKSNEADIIYIDTYPGIYTDYQPADPGRPLNVVAHEYQHLIHANSDYGRLITFQNEAQSEVSEIINGFGARNMRFLENRHEISGNVTTGGGSGLYRWRRNDINAVLMDYQRAGLFHAYFHERFGAEATGRLTRGPSGRMAYEEILDSYGLDWAEFLTDFYAANLLNNPDPAFHDGVYGYSQQQLTNVRATGFANEYAMPHKEIAEKEVSITYGGAKYIKWKAIEDLQLNLNGDEAIRYFAVTRSSGESARRFMHLEPGSTVFQGEYDSIIFAAVNTLEHNNSEENPGTRSFTYSTGQSTELDDPREVVSSYKLIGNHPNPFNPATTISYRLPRTSHVRIDIYDVTGRKVKTLINGQQPEGTYHEVFHADNLASGLYIYHLRADDFVDSKKMLLVK